MAKKQKKGSWIVRVQCKVVKEIVCDDCTEEQARENPWEYGDGEEHEVDQPDWDVVSVKPNE